ncbi:MAG: hypothetical protein MJ236_07635, partial [Clostridia bacterium]|nr:hypothetical protein [Clostridia bacterium]
MSEDINIHKCPSCGMGLGFDASSGKLKCESCGNLFDIEAIDSIEKGEEANTEFDWGDYKKSLNVDDIKNSKTYICKSCGAEIISDENTAATICPYCDSPIIINDRVDDNLRPNGIIPFKITKAELPQKIKEFYKKKKLLPKDFFSANKLEAAQGVYVPFWLYDCHIDGQIGFKATKTITYRSGDY